MKVLKIWMIARRRSGRANGASFWFHSVMFKGCSRFGGNVRGGSPRTAFSVGGEFYTRRGKGQTFPFRTGKSKGPGSRGNRGPDVGFSGVGLSPHSGYPPWVRHGTRRSPYEDATSTIHKLHSSTGSPPCSGRTRHGGSQPSRSPDRPGPPGIAAIAAVGGAESSLHG